MPGSMQRSKQEMILNSVNEANRLLRDAKRLQTCNPSASELAQADSGTSGKAALVGKPLCSAVVSEVGGREHDAALF